MTRPVLLMALACALDVARPALAAAHPKAPEPVAALEYLFADRAVFDVVAAPGRITDIALEPGETLVETNPIAAGDTARWVIGDTTSGQGARRRVHVLVKPVQSNLSTNLIINTNQRSYHLQLRASSRAYLSQVVWRYPQTPPLSVPPQRAAPVVVLPPPPPSPLSPGPAQLSFDYRLKGSAPWRPARVFDDGVRTYIAFGPEVALSDLPPLFLVGPDGKASHLLNYRVVGRDLVVDRLFERAELRFGQGRWERRVRIIRQASSGEAGR